MGREIRCVHPDWKHPLLGERSPNAAQPDWPIPLLAGSYIDAVRDYRDEVSAYVFKYEHGETLRTVEGLPIVAWTDYLAQPKDYMPDWTDEEKTAYQIYENVSEGTPVSPVFKTVQEMVDWLVSEGYSEKSARLFAKGGYVPTMRYDHATGEFKLNIHMLDDDDD